MDKLTVGLFNDSFPPTIDGVANVTLNYADIIQKKHGKAVVATPFYPGVNDNYPFEVIRYPSVYIYNVFGYRTGYPFASSTLYELEKKDFDIIHSHCPVVSTVLGRTVRRQTHVPLVFTYHTKFDIDIKKMTPSDTLQKAAVKFLISNISECDEVWVVSEGAGRNLDSLGYEGKWHIMPNGVDFERGRSKDSEVRLIKARHRIPEDEPMFLFVGRMMWYKGVRISLDGIKRALDSGYRCHFVLIGEGVDRPEITKYAAQLGISDRCHFTGAIQDRELIRTYFTAADLFLFPSTFDTNGIVVREAAACGCPSVLIKDSCAAEGIADGDTGIIIDENSHSMAAAIEAACNGREGLKRIGQNAQDKIYLSWEDAVGMAVERYHIIKEQRIKETDDASLSEVLNAKVLQINSALGEFREQVLGILDESVNWLDYKVDKTLGPMPSESVLAPHKSTKAKKTKKQQIQKQERK